MKLQTFFTQTSLEAAKTSKVGKATQKRYNPTPSIVPKFHPLTIAYHKGESTTYNMPLPPKYFPQPHIIPIPHFLGTPTPLLLPIVSPLSLDSKMPLFHLQTSNSIYKCHIHGCDMIEFWFAFNLDFI